MITLMPKTDALILTAHKERVANAKTFEEFKEAQLLYLDWLIAYFDAKADVAELIVKFVGNATEFIKETNDD